MKRFKAVVIGGSGYGGGEMIRRLLLHPEVELLRVASLDYVGEPLSAAHPNLEGVTDLVFEELPPERAAAGADVVLLGLPHKVSALVVPKLIPLGVKIVDMSGDFRLQDAAAYERFYGKKHPCPELLPRFVYGLPELSRERIRQSSTVASPGCFATTIELGLLPLARAGLLSGAVQTVAMTGSSGSGVAASAGTHHPVRYNNIKTYKTLSHQHVPEIEETLRSARRRRLRASLRSGERAAGAGHLRHQLRSSAEDHDRRRDPRTFSRCLRRRALRSRAQQAVARGRCRRGLQPRGGGRRGRPR